MKFHDVRNGKIIQLEQENVCIALIVDDAQNVLAVNYFTSLNDAKQAIAMATCFYQNLSKNPKVTYSNFLEKFQELTANKTPDSFFAVISKIYSQNDNDN